MNETPTLSADLGRYIADLDASRIGDAARKRAVHAITDTVGVMLAGLRSTTGRSILEFAELAESGGESPLVGTSLRRSPQTAALVNGVLGHAMDFDDCVAPMPGHPSAVVVPALLSGTYLTGEPRTGEDFLESYIVGIEVGTRLGQTFGMGHYHHGWHSTGTIALFSGIAALGRLLRLDAPTVAAALGLGTSMASGLQVQFGSPAKPLHSGLAARNATSAVQLALAGMRPASDAFEGKSGFFAVFGADTTDWSRLIPSLGTPFVLADPGTHLKAFPCCNALHRPIDAVLGLRHDHAMTADHIAQIDVFVPPGGLRPLIDRYPSDATEAKFHLGYTVAAALIDGDVTLETYTDDAVGRTDLADLARRVKAHESTDNLHQGEKERIGSIGSRGFVNVAVTMRDGTSVSARVDVPPGAPGRDMSRDQVSAKFLSCAAFSDLDADWSSRLLEALLSLDTMSDVSALELTLDSDPAVQA